MRWWIIPLLLIIAALIYLVYRALQFRPLEALGQRAPQPLRVPEMPIAIKLSELVQLPTVSGAPEDEDPAAFLAFTERLHALYPHVAKSCHRLLVGERGIVYCWRGQSDQQPHVLLAHYDVLPATGEGWARPPFSGEIAEGYVHGRGARDGKCRLAAAMEAADGLIADGFVPQQDVYLCFVGDEQIHGQSGQAILQALEESGVTPGLVLCEGGGVSEAALPGLKLPAALVGIGEKGLAELTIRAKGKAGDTQAPPRHTAVGQLARGISRLERWPWPMRFAKPVQAMVDKLGRHASFPYRLIYANLKFLRPLIGLVTGFMGGRLSAALRTSCAFTMAQGAQRVHQMPEEALARASIHLMPGENSRSARRRAARILGSKRFEAEVQAVSEPGPVSRSDDAIFSLLSQAIGEVWPEALIAPCLTLDCTTGRHYGRASEHVYRFSALPVGGVEEAVSGAVNERISLGSLARCQAFYEALMSRL